MERDLTKKNVFVTGAGKGIGKSLVLSLLDKGAYVYALTKSDKTLDELKKYKNLKIFYQMIAKSSLILKLFQVLAYQKKKTF